jgi:hypothetical protein
MEDEIAEYLIESGVDAGKIIKPYERMKEIGKE